MTLIRDVMRFGVGMASLYNSFVYDTKLSEICSEICSDS